ncbi:MAG: type II secretion system protein GspE, partial [Elusimicrobiota bacterium]
MCKIVDALLADGRITRGQLSDAEQKRIGAKKPLQELLVEMGFVREEQLMATTSRVLGMPVADLKIETVEPEALSKIPYTAAKRHGAFPLRRENGHLVVAMSNPQDLVAVDDLTIMCGVQVRP